MSLNSATVTVVNPLEQPVAAKKRGWLPLLTVLFLISYGLMTMLIIEQGATIESQRALIRELFRDSTELSALKMHANNNAAATTAKGKLQAPSTQNAVTKPTQSPSTQAPSKQIPSSQAVPQQRAQKQSQKPQFQMPSKPASDLADQERSLITI
ncbi:MAG: hypothetical protein WAN03_07410 [Candidatus Sulfotelmatobacter sp.]